MLRGTKLLLLLVVLGTFATLCQAATFLLCTEDAVLGCIAQIPTSSPALFVASDGESSFTPFGLTFDVSDAILLNENWAPDPAYAASFGAFGWQQLPGTFVWYLPADLGPCGSENEPICEPVGKWYFTPGSPWNQGTPDFLVMLDPDGVTWSDVILVNNTGPSGSAAITFSSDPSVIIPEPSLGLLTGLIAGVALYIRRRRA